MNATDVRFEGRYVSAQERTKMTYIKVRWIHSHADEPILLYSELDEGR